MKKPVVNLIGEDGNAFAIMSKVKNALNDELGREFLKEACDGDYDHLLRTAMKYVEVE